LRIAATAGGGDGGGRHYAGMKALACHGSVEKNLPFIFIIFLFFL
jgi:hypothetical protein